MGGGNSEVRVRGRDAWKQASNTGTDPSHSHWWEGADDYTRLKHRPGALWAGETLGLRDSCFTHLLIQPFIHSLTFLDQGVC